MAPSTKKLCYAIQWLLVDKFVKDETLKNLLQNKMGERMGAVYDYGERKRKEGKEEIILNLQNQA